MKNFVLLFTACLLLVNIESAYSQELKPVGDDVANAISAALGTSKGITKARLVTDGEQSITVEADYAGLEDGDYTLKAAILNKVKKEVSEVPVITEEITKTSGTIDLRFQFKAKSGYTSTEFETHYLELTLSKAGNALSGFEIGGTNLFATKFLYELKKSWRVGGSESIVVDVKLTPYKSAASIQK